MKLRKILVGVMASTMVTGFLAMAVESNAATANDVLLAPDMQTFDSIDKASATELANFKADPQSLLKSNPIGGFQLESMAKALALTDPSTVATLIEIISSANALQIAAIGSGLGQAAKQLNSSTDKASQKAGQKIQSQIEAVESAALNKAFEGGLNGNAPGTGKTVIQNSFSNFSGGAVGGGVGGAVNQVGSNGGPQGGATTNTPPAKSASNLNTTESIPFSGAVVTCTSSVSPVHAC